MLLRHFQKYLSHRFTIEIEKQIGSRIKSGVLSSDGAVFPIRDFIPRFTQEASYADSFGFQWHKFRTTQMNRSGKALSFQRFYTFTGWKPSDLKGKEVLEVGCGAGRFTEILLEAGANVVSFDLSNAVDVCYENNVHRNLLAMQADIHFLPLRAESFDFVFCYGVLQHTIDPLKAFQSLVRYTKQGGRISADNYVFSLFSPFCTPKYAWRWLTKRLPPMTLLKIIQAYVPAYLPLDTYIKKAIPFGPGLAALIPIPCWNYCGMGLNDEVRKEWAILDTFDALSAWHDHPKRVEDFQKACVHSHLREIDVSYGSIGLVVNARR